MSQVNTVLSLRLRLSDDFVRFHFDVVCSVSASNFSSVGNNQNQFGTTVCIIEWVEAVQPQGREAETAHEPDGGNGRSATIPGLR